MNYLTWWKKFFFSRYLDIFFVVDKFTKFKIRKEIIDINAHLKLGFCLFL